MEDEKVKRIIRHDVSSTIFFIVSALCFARDCCHGALSLTQCCQIVSTYINFLAVNSRNDLHPVLQIVGLY
jgi:hypothetical protein